VRLQRGKGHNGSGQENQRIEQSVGHVFRAVGLALPYSRAGTNASRRGLLTQHHWTGTFCLRADSPHTPRFRLLLGLLQGAALYALYQSHDLKVWPATEPLWFAPLLMLAVLLPLLGGSAWGRLSARAWWHWLAVALGVVAALAVYDLWRMGPVPQVRSPLVFPSFNAWAFISVGLFMAQALVLSAAHDGRRVASYTTYFDEAWKLGIQLLFSVFFVGALWLMLWLGAALFGLIGLRFLRALLSESWFNLPVSAMAMAWALHLTDVKPDIVRGIRGLLLVLLSWILPVVTVLASGFLGSLLFTGLEPLWATRQATSVLLVTTASLVVLINTAFQNGERAEQVNRVVRFCARLACGLLLPLVGLAAYALSLRVAQHGWTSDRVIAAACQVVAQAYALGYAWAAVSRQSGWLAPMAWVNVRVSWLILVTLLALFSPLLDPARIGVNDQLQRLREGRIRADQLDYRYLRFDAGRFGEEAVRALAKGELAGVPVAEAAAAARGAQAALAWKSRYDMPERRTTDRSLDAAGLRRNVKAVWPHGASLPDSFLAATWNSQGRMAGFSADVPSCLRQRDTACEAVLLQMDDDPAQEVLILQPPPIARVVLFDQDAQQVWQLVGTLPTHLVTCEAHVQRLREGRFDVVPARMRELRLGDVPVSVRDDGWWLNQPPTPLPPGCR
jgi:hypothetical protein